MTKDRQVNLTEIERFDAEIECGLTTEQVELRQNQKLTNVVKDRHSKSYLGIFLSNIFTYSNIIFLCVFTCLIVLTIVYDDIRPLIDAFFMVIVGCNIIIGIYQEIRAKVTVGKLKLLSEPMARVMRNCEYKDIRISDVVLDDILIFSAGKQICTDCIIKHGSVEVNESLLTGEADSVSKTIGDELLSGSYIVAGSCYATAHKVGNSNYVASLSAIAKKHKKPKSKILDSLSRFVLVIGIILPILASIIFFTKESRASDYLERITSTSGAVVGLIPAGAFLLCSVALFAGTVRLAKRRCLVQDMYGIEMLARVNVLCLDKTGTITDGKMSVADFVVLKKDFEINPGEIISNMVNALTDDNQTSIALKEYFKLKDTFLPLNIFPFSSVKKMSAVTFEKIGTFAIGAPEFVLPKISAALDKKISKFTKAGFRVLALGYSSKTDTDKDLTLNMSPLALVVLSDNIREDAVETINWFKENDVEIKIISGDNPVTVSEVAKRAGVLNAEKYISLDKLDNDKVIEAATQYTVFGRVSPSQKALIIKTLKLNGNTVGMTGDGVNDILAMKESDCSISIASGSEAARNVSHIVLMNSDFSPMPRVVAEGRRVINNLQRSSSLFLMKTFFVFLVCIYTIILQQKYAFKIKQMFPLELFIIGFASLILTLEKNEELIKGNFLSTIMKNAVPASVVMFLTFLTLTLIKAPLNLYENITALSVCAVGLMYLLKICMPFTRRRVILLAFVSLVIPLCYILAPEIFGLTKGEGATPPIWGLEHLMWYDYLILALVFSISFLLIKIFTSNRFKKITNIVLQKCKDFFAALVKLFKRKPRKT